MTGGLRSWVAAVRGQASGTEANSSNLASTPPVTTFRSPQPLPLHRPHDTMPYPAVTAAAPPRPPPPEGNALAKHTAIYARVSSRSQDTESQEPDLKRWAEAQPDDSPSAGTATSSPARRWTGPASTGSWPTSPPARSPASSSGGSTAWAAPPRG